MRIADLLRNKGSKVPTVSPDTPVAELVAGMAEHYIGPMAVMGAGGLMGIVTQPQIVRKLLMQGTDLLGLPVSAFMTTVRITCAPDDTIDDVRRLMAEQRARHVPVISHGEFVGIVSVDDVAKTPVGELTAEQEELHTTITRG